MTEERKAKLIERDKAMRIARDQVLRLVSQHLVSIGFKSRGVGHFVRGSETRTDHIGFQKLTSGRAVRVMSHISLNDTTPASITGPWSDKYDTPDSPNRIRYNFAWSTKEEDISQCAAEYCRFIDDVLLPWFSDRIPT